MDITSVLLRSSMNTNLISLISTCLITFSITLSTVFRWCSVNFSHSCCFLSEPSILLCQLVWRYNIYNSFYLYFRFALRKSSTSIFVTYVLSLVFVSLFPHSLKFMIFLYFYIYYVSHGCLPIYMSSLWPFVQPLFNKELKSLLKLTSF